MFKKKKKKQQHLRRQFFIEELAPSLWIPSCSRSPAQLSLKHALLLSRKSLFIWSRCLIGFLFCVYFPGSFQGKEFERASSLLSSEYPDLQEMSVLGSS